MLTRDDLVALEDDETIVINPSTITLTPDQENALLEFNKFLTNPLEKVFVLRGYSGCGKSTLVKTILDRLTGFIKAAKLLNPSLYDYTVALTATTNKAAESLSFVSGMQVETIHRFLGLKIKQDFRTGTTELIPKNSDIRYGHLLFIDEASYIDKELLNWIFKRTENCKIVFVGDPAQLTPVKSMSTPVFDAGFPGAALTTVVRQQGTNTIHPIAALAEKFRNAVNDGQPFTFKPDGFHIQHLSRNKFMNEVMAEFTRPDWKYRDSKVLAWTNKCVINYNHLIRDAVKGDPNFQPGDYAVVNQFISIGNTTLKTDETVQIIAIEDDERLDVKGKIYTLESGVKVFGPNSLADKKLRLTKARKIEDIRVIAEIEQSWIDLRAAYACTINKAQGSTYDKVFIDLDDVRRCTSGDQIYRMMYVAVSRPRHHVYLTGDFG